MTEKDRDNTMLDDLFAAARSDTRQAPPPDLLARVLADAEAEQPTAEAFDTTRVRRPGRWQQFVTVIGGWPSLTGLAAATMASVWIGFSASTTMLPYGLSNLVTGDAELYLTYLETGEFIDDEDL
ncbi:hypothetical protein [Shimia sediminis]|uniref:hypothetical protein n=1 Tax=Shimia sediminis TaxID=2497945 RepID=UPI000F8F212A|nr:hypothetical protein [Shimia sediminis]